MLRAVRQYKKGGEMKYLVYIFFLLIIGCHQKSSSPKKEKKGNTIYQMLSDSIDSKNQIKDCFMDYKFGDLNSVVSSKTKNYLNTGKLTYKPPFIGARYKSLLYNFELREASISFAISFEFTNKNELYKMELHTLYPHLTYSSVASRNFKKIVGIYQEKYKSKWHFKKFIPTGSNIEWFEYENVEGNRHISLKLFGNAVTITYTNLTLEENFKKYNRNSRNNLNPSKKDI